MRLHNISFLTSFLFNNKVPILVFLHLQINQRIQFVDTDQCTEILIDSRSIWEELMVHHHWAVLSLLIYCFPMYLVLLWHFSSQFCNFPCLDCTYFYLSCIYLFSMCVRMHACYSVCVKTAGQLVEVVSFHYVDFRDQTQEVRLGALYPLTHFASLHFLMFNT